MSTRASLHFLCPILLVPGVEETYYKLNFHSGVEFRHMHHDVAKVKKHLLNFFLFFF